MGKFLRHGFCGIFEFFQIFRCDAAVAVQVKVTYEDGGIIKLQIIDVPGSGGNVIMGKGISCSGFFIVITHIGKHACTSVGKTVFFLNIPDFFVA